MKQSINQRSSRRKFIQQSGAFLGGAFLVKNLAVKAFPENLNANRIKVNAHLWVYASRFPPQWDSTPVLESVFADLSYAGIDGVELMDINLRKEDAVKNINNLIKKYNFPVSGTSYGSGFNMWEKNQQKEILEDIKVIVARLSRVKGKTFGISVGTPGRLKTGAELDTQADLLRKIWSICKDNGIVPNLHNHTYEIENDMHDLKGTLQRIPDINLGPDINWLIRGGINPVDFINTYGRQIVYLHLRDQYADGTWTEYVGQGVTDFPAIASALKAQHFNGSAALELAFPEGFKPENPLKEDWKMSRQYVNKVFGW